MSGYTGNGATITFGTQSFTGKYREIGELNQEREVVDTTTLDIPTGSFAQNIPGDNPAPGQVRCRIRWEGAEAPVAFAAPETITITMPEEVSASAAPANVAGTGYIVSRRLLPNLQRNQLNEGEFVIQFDGITGPTYTPEA
jgi:hypothetical protein